MSIKTGRRNFEKATSLNIHAFKNRNKEPFFQDSEKPISLFVFGLMISNRKQAFKIIIVISIILKINTKKVK